MAYVVERRGHCAGPDVVGVSGDPGSVDCVCVGVSATGLFETPEAGMGGQGRTVVGIREQDNDQRVRAPGVLDDAWPEAQRKEARQSPDILKDRDQGALIKPLGRAGEEEQRYDVKYGL